MVQESVDQETVVQSLVKALRSAGAAASQHGGASFTIWPDRNHEWQGVVETLKEIMPELYVFGDYDPSGRILVVVYTQRGENLRLISARAATGRERNAYEEGI